MCVLLLGVRCKTERTYVHLVPVCHLENLRVLLLISFLSPCPDATIAVVTLYFSDILGYWAFLILNVLWLKRTRRFFVLIGEMCDIVFIRY